MQKLCMKLIVVCVLSVSADAEVNFNDFDKDIGQWPTGSSQLDSYGIVGGELSIDGYGYVPHRNNENWGIRQSKELSFNFGATSDDRNTFYDTTSFTLPAHFAPGKFQNSLGYTEDGYFWHPEDRYRWIDYVVSSGFVLGLLGLGMAGRKFCRLRPTYARNQPGPGSYRKPKPQFPYDVLGVGSGATKEEIKKAYREISKLYHPDKTAHRSEELRDLAHHKMQQINAAYESLMGD